MKALVTFATKYGATAEIAGKIYEILNQEGVPADLLPVKEVRDLTPYTAVILGSAVYIGRWRKEAAKFLETNENLLGERDVWLFSSGPTGEGDPVERLDGWQLPDAQMIIAERIKPHDIAVFHGDLDTGKLNFVEKFMINKMEAPTGDFRDWQSITAWAESVANTLKQPQF